MDDKNYGENNQLAGGSIVWDGTKTEDTFRVPVGTRSAVLLHINNEPGIDLTVTLEHNTDGDNWAPVYDGTGALISFVAKGSSNGVYGPFQSWPRFLGGRVKLKGATAPPNKARTTLRVQEV